MGAFIGFIIFVAIIYFIFKLFEHNEREKTGKNVDDCNNNTKTTSTSSKKNITENNSVNNENEESVAENNMPKFKYNNEVYISFTKKTYKAFEAFKAIGENVNWVAEKDGFRLIRETGKFVNPEAVRAYECFEAFVYRDDDNELDLTDPYYLCITYNLLVNKSDFDYYRDFCEYINDYNRTHNMFNKELFMSHVVFPTKNAKVVKYCCSAFFTDRNLFDNQIKKFGAGAVFDSFFETTKNKYIGGLELYEARNR